MTFEEIVAFVEQHGGWFGGAKHGTLHIYGLMSDRQYALCFGGPDHATKALDIAERMLCGKCKTYLEKMAARMGR